MHQKMHNAQNAARSERYMYRRAFEHTKLTILYERFLFQMQMSYAHIQEHKLIYLQNAQSSICKHKTKKSKRLP